MYYWVANRRNFLKLAGVTSLAASVPSVGWAQNKTSSNQQGDQFPSDFKWGVGTAAAQVESRRGRGPSNWDRFIDTGQRVRDGSTNIINTDFENRFMDDFRLLADAGVQSFRFSFAWPRIQPEGAGAINQEGLDTYERIIDGMLELGIEPFATIFHWDMPVWAGDLRDRDVAYHMADYADILTRRFADRIPIWAILNEPNSVAFAGYMLGMHAPGLTLGETAGSAIHHQNLALGLMAQAARANLDKDSTLTTTVNLAPMRASVNHQVEPALLQRADEFWNRSFLDPAYGKGYPLNVLPLVSPYIKADDLDIIAFQPETIGVNYYSRLYVQPNDQVPVGFVPDLDGAPANTIRTDQYFFEPDGLTEILQWVSDRYGQPSIFLTETGFSLKDAAPQDGVVHDPLREKYLQAYLRAALDAINQGVDLKGMHYWAASDNFEWAEGFGPKFGLIKIQEGTLNRIPKSSLNYYGQCIRANAVI